VAVCRFGRLVSAAIAHLSVSPLDCMTNLDVPVWSNDGTQVYHRGVPVSGADPKTFEVLLGNYARDGKSVFFRNVKSKTIDRATFRVLNANFGVDSASAYFAFSPIRDADPASFRVLDSSFVHNGASYVAGAFLQAGYAADAHSVWFASGDGVFGLKTADPKTFVSLGNRFGHDSEHVYFERGALPGVDRSTWRPWREAHSVDKDSVFFTNKKILGVDRASICLLSATGCFMDRHHIYCNAEVISSERYLAHLKYVANRCAQEQEQIPNGKMFERLLFEWAKEI
jgi:hypothetical protein